MSTVHAEPASVAATKALRGVPDRELLAGGFSDLPPASPSSDELPRPPVRWRELIAVALLILLADLTIYRGEGFAGYAALFALAPLLLLMGAPHPRISGGLWVLMAMALVVAGRMVWLGGPLLTTIGFALIVLIAMSLAGWKPHLLEGVGYAFQTLFAGGRGLADYVFAQRRMSTNVPRNGWLKVMMPVAALAGFGTLFVMANPDLARTVADGFRTAFEWVRTQIERFRIGWAEPFFWIAVAWIVAGLFRPITWNESAAEPTFDRPEEENAPSPLYPAIRNTLVTLIVLFAAYLAFEFQTLWLREFPKGFHYSGYAHEGAAWLTAALALATAVVSAIFRGRMLTDPSLPRVRRLTWIWSAQNLLLAVAVYHRLFIYVGFNGMTRMRTVGLLGISAVVVGFVLTIWKIVHRRDFWWLVRRDLWTLAIAVFLFAVLPVDAMVHTYNVRRILAGDSAPSVQISVHPIDSHGAMVLRPLVHAPDPVIRDGIRALLAQRQNEVAIELQSQERQGWTSYQHADHVLHEKLTADAANWSEFTDRGKRLAAIVRFHEYAYQWY